MTMEPLTQDTARWVACSTDLQHLLLGRNEAQEKGEKAGNSLRTDSAQHPVLNEEIRTAALASGMHREWSDEETWAGLIRLLDDAADAPPVEGSRTDKLLFGAAVLMNRFHLSLTPEQEAAYVLPGATDGMTLARIRPQTGVKRASMADSVKLRKAFITRLLGHEDATSFAKDKPVMREMADAVLTALLRDVTTPPFDEGPRRPRMPHLNDPPIGRESKVVLAFSVCIGKCMLQVLDSHLPQVGTFREFGERLELLIDIRDFYEEFEPAAFDPIVIQHGYFLAAPSPELPARDDAAVQREILMALAKPGVRIADVPAAYQRLLKLRLVWTRFGGQVPPRVLPGLSECHEEWLRGMNALQLIDDATKVHRYQGSLSNLQLDDLVEALSGITDRRAAESGLGILDPEGFELSPGLVERADGSVGFR